MKKSFFARFVLCSLLVIAMQNSAFARCLFDVDQDKCLTSIIDENDCSDGYAYSTEIETCVMDGQCPNGGRVHPWFDACAYQATYACSDDGYDLNDETSLCEAAAACFGTSALNEDTDRCETDSFQVCPDSYTIDESLGLCESDPVCPDDSTYDAAVGKCVGSIQISCDTGYTINSSSGLCEISPTCPSGTSYSAVLDKCAADVTKICPSGYTFNSTTNKCERLPQCSTGVLYGSSQCKTAVTKVCSSGFTYVAARDRCEVVPTCSAGSYNATNNRCEYATQYKCPVSGAVYGSLTTCNNACLVSGSCTRTSYNVGGICQTYAYSAWCFNLNYQGYYNWSSPSCNTFDYYDGQADIGNYVGLVFSCHDLYRWYNGYQIYDRYTCNVTGSYFDQFCSPATKASCRTQYLNQCNSQCVKTTSCSSICPTGMSVSGSVCIKAATCPTGSTLDGATDRCVKAVSNQCPTGFTYNASINACLTTAQCATGGTLNASAGVCQADATNSCLDGTSYEASRDQCESGATCSDGAALNTDDDLCQKDANSGCSSGLAIDSSLQLCAADVTCSDGGVFNSDKDLCEVSSTTQCDVGFTLDTETNICYAEPFCESPGSYNSDSNTCIDLPILTCAEGFELDETFGECVQDVTCPNDGVFSTSDNLCVEEPGKECVSGDFESVKSVTFTISPSSPQLDTSNVVVQIEVTADGSENPVEYRLMKQLQGDADWELVQDYSVINILSWDTKFEDPGTYNLRIDARNICSGDEYEINQIEEYEILQHLTAQGVSIEADLDSPQEAGRIITFTATGDPADGLYLYRYWIRPVTQGQWSLAYDYTTKNTWIWDTQGYAAGDYIIKVDIKATESTVDLEATAQMSYTLTEESSADTTATIVNCETDSSCNIKIYRSDAPNIFAKHTISVAAQEEEIPVNNLVPINYDGIDNYIFCDGTWQNLSSDSGNSALQNQINCSVSQDRLSIAADLILFDQETYNNPYSTEPAQSGFPSLESADKNSPSCLHEKSPKTADACKWQEDQGDETWLVFGETTVSELELVYMIPEVDPIETPTTYCGKDFNQDGVFQEGEIGTCFGDLCTVDMVQCLDTVSEPICPDGGSLNPDTDKCEQDDFERCSQEGYVYDATIGKCIKWESCYNICPDTYTYSYDQNLCVKSPCQSPAQYNAETGRCEMTYAYDCPINGQQFADQPSCDQNCSNIGVCTPVETNRCIVGWSWGGSILGSNAWWLQWMDPFGTHCNQNVVEHSPPIHSDGYSYDAGHISLNEDQVQLVIDSSDSPRDWLYLLYPDINDPVTGETPSWCSGIEKLKMTGLLVTPPDATPLPGIELKCSYIHYTDAWDYDSGASYGNKYYGAYFSLRGEVKGVCNIDNSIYNTMEDCTTSCVEVAACASTCLDGYSTVGNLCIKAPACSSGGIFNQTTMQCEIEPDFDSPDCAMDEEIECASGYEYNPTTDMCEVLPICEAGAYRPESDDCLEGYYCPYGDQYSCYNYSNGNQYCSPYECVPIDEGVADIGDPEGENDKDDDGEIDEEGNCIGTVYIFNGHDRRCRSGGVTTMFANCCKHDDYLFGLQKCDEDEIQLAKLRTNKQCHYLGEYCSKEESITGFCLEHKESYCCFNSMLGRIIQEQGRPTLKDHPGWGTAESPICRGFTKEEFQMLNWDSINFDEWLPEIETTNQSEIKNNMNDAVTDYYDKN